MDIDNLRICTDKNRGMRKYMEDEFRVLKDNDREPTTFLGIFDGHGGKEAAIYAKNHLFENIKLQQEFYSSNIENVKEAIKKAFWKTHYDMFNIVDTWPRRRDGHNSTSGTTATVVIIRGTKLIIAHVGDSAAVLAEKKDNQYVAEELTVDHKPESPAEKSRIESLGGKVGASNGVPRVVWKRSVQQVTPPTYEYVPFLAVSRALGDLWSYDETTKHFIVSPEPDIKHIDFKEDQHKFLVLASDGLWGVMNAKETVECVWKYEIQHEKSRHRNCSMHLNQEALKLWRVKRARADNISAIVVFLDNEFNNVMSDDCESVTSSEAATVIISNGEEEDTPPMPADNGMSSLVRQLALPYGGSYSESSGEASQTVDEPDIKDVPPAGQNKSSQSSGSSSKRKIVAEINTVVPPYKLRKLRSSPPAPSSPVTCSEESHQCNVITVLSTESLYGLQLDENLADDEPTVDDEEDVSLDGIMSGGQNIDGHLKFMPVPQATK